jgi:hypothetical protein
MASLCVTFHPWLHVCLRGSPYDSVWVYRGVLHPWLCSLSLSSLFCSSPSLHTLRACLQKGKLVCTQNFSTIAKTWKQHKQPLAEDGVNDIWYDEILFDHEKKLNTDTSYSVCEPWSCAKWKKPVIKYHIVQISVHRKCPELESCVDRE